MYQTLRRLLFKLDPELAHKYSLRALQFLQRIHLMPTLTLAKPKNIMGLTFTNPIGLAAGLDKDGDYIDALAALGFGFLEIGTVTPLPQIGNPTPRLFRLTQANAIINRMGFNSKGIEHLITQVKQAKYDGILGINIGKNATTPLADAASDYLFGFKAVYPYASYITINISSPNTTDLRQLQTEKYLHELLVTLKQSQIELTREHNRYVPLVVKIAPDLSSSELSMMTKIFLELSIDGVIATNTTTSRELIQHIETAKEPGGLSGEPLFIQSTTILRQLKEELKGKIPIIACGGIMSATDAQAKFEAGADLIQLYTGLIYRGPELIREIFKII